MTKAFVIVNHKTLFSILDRYGFRSEVNNHSCSYLFVFVFLSKNTTKSIMQTAAICYVVCPVRGCEKILMCPVLTKDSHGHSVAASYQVLAVITKILSRGRIAVKHLIPFRTASFRLINTLKLVD